ncbi:MAG: TIGR03936 family radical SAM-associated protein [Oscillospiraceae bacterium]|nr:TIGR03936 family radical SAM-associated protein [Oscillospiraceae bacterium]
MGKLRLLFVKEGRAVYISHLDLLRTFQRVFLRQGMVLRHSQGFHPHPIISFALPLSVGQASDCEILDFEVNEDMDGVGLPEALNAFMPEGVRAVDCYVPVRPVRELARLRCRVELVYDGGVPAGAAEEIRKLLLGESVVIQKRTKRKAMADIDIRPMLHSLELQESACLLTLEAEVSAQNPGMNPALLAAAVEVHRPELSPDFVRVRRLAVLDAEGKVFR